MKVFQKSGEPIEGTNTKTLRRLVKMRKYNVNSKWTYNQDNDINLTFKDFGS